MPQPTQEHAWLEKFVGEWETEIEMQMEPGQPPMKSTGSHTDRMMGGFWLISEGGNDAMPYRFLLTLGYDEKKKKYIGTWADSMTSYLWNYFGSVNSAGNTLALETEGPSPAGGGKFAKYREVTEFKSASERHFTSSFLGEDGQWTTFLRIVARKK